jgi:hypothetical protein
VQLLILLWFAIGLIPASIAHRKGRSVVGFWIFGMLAWPIALIVVLIAMPDYRVLDERVAQAGAQSAGVRPR